MKTYGMILLVTVAAAMGCDKPNDTGVTQTTSAPALAPDNTRLNARDNSGSVTPIDQGNGSADISTTQTIRQAIMADDTLSINAKNVKVVTGNGVITLRGPVQTPAEKDAIEAKALAAAGNNRIDDQLEVQAAH